MHIVIAVSSGTKSWKNSLVFKMEPDKSGRVMDTVPGDDRLGTDKAEDVSSQHS